MNSTLRWLGTVGVFVAAVLLTTLACVPAWDGLVNGTLYYCTDGGSMDFILGPDAHGWVHEPESVPKVVQRTMSERDEIKIGWSNNRLRQLWRAFLGSSLLVSAVLAVTFWRVTGRATSAQMHSHV